MSVPPELRVPQSADADCPRREVACRHCRGFGECLHIRSAGDSFAPIGWPDREWCCECGGAAFLLVPCLPDGASARLGAMLVEAMPHLRHATWPPKEARGGTGDGDRLGRDGVSVRRLGPDPLADKVLGVISIAPATLSEIANHLSMTSDNDVSAIRRALNRLKRRGAASCNVDRPYTKWHLVRGCPCTTCRGKEAQDA